MIKGKLIVIEGTDGCGKQTQTDYLYKNLINLGLKVAKISFPNYNSPCLLYTSPSPRDRG